MWKGRKPEAPPGAGVKRRPPFAVVTPLVALICLIPLTLACGSESRPTHTTATIPATTGTLSIATEPTPKPATGLRKVELEAAYGPVYVDGIEYATIGSDDQLYIISVETGQRTQVTDD